MYKNQLLSRYFTEWVETYKRGAVSPITLRKYLQSEKMLASLAPAVTLGNLSRLEYQRILNAYALTHKRQTVMDFHHQIKAAIEDAVDEGVIRHDPTRKAVIKGKTPHHRKQKFLSQYELKSLISVLRPDDQHPYDFLLLVIAKTGLRFAEALGLTPADIDLQSQLLNVSKTWNYKSPAGGFAPTKNESSNRKIRLDWMLCMQLKQLCDGRDPDQPIFVRPGQRIFNANVNQRLSELCKEAKVPVISVHGLRHTHASLLLYAGVSVASVAKRLGHANMTTTETTYLHIIRELEAKDSDKVMQFLSTL